MTNAERLKERRIWLHEKHFCVDCKTQDAFTISGKFRCAECSEKARFRESGRSIKRQDWYEMGLCTRCGKNPPAEGFRVCDSCRQIYVKMSAISHRNDRERKQIDGRPNPKIPRREWVANGFCWLCGEPRLHWCNVCQSCRDRFTNQSRNQDHTEQQKILNDIFAVNKMYREMRKNDKC